MASKIKVDQLETADGTGTIALQNQLSGLTNASMPTGSVLQTVYGTTNTRVVSTSNSFSDTGLTATITPSSASSVILVTYHQNGCIKANDNAANDFAVALFKDGAEQMYSAIYNAYTGTAMHLYSGTSSLQYLVAASSTNAIVFKTRFRNADGGAAGGTVEVQNGGCTSTMILQEIAG